MLKIRLMGKKEDMHEMIKKIYQIKGIEVMELSDFYTNNVGCIDGIEGYSRRFS